LGFVRVKFQKQVALMNLAFTIVDNIATVLNEVCDLELSKC